MAAALTAFFGSFLQYVIIMIILALIAVLGAKLGAKWRLSKNAKEAAAQTDAADAKVSVSESSRPDGSSAK